MSKNKKVRCDSDDLFGLVSGKVYEVLVETQSRYQLVGVRSYQFDKCYFSIVNMVKVKCIQDAYLWSNEILVGQVFEVEEVFGQFEYEINGVLWNKNLFILIGNNDGPITIPSPPPTIMSNDEQEELRLRALLKPRVEKDECICGIKRAQCKYHPPDEAFIAPSWQTS